MQPFRSSINQSCRTLLGMLICWYLLADHVSGIISDLYVEKKSPIFRRFHGLNEASYLRSLRSALKSDGTGYVAFPLISRSATMISGRGFRPGKRMDTEIMAFM